MSTDKIWTDEDWANLSDEDLFELDIPNEGEEVYSLVWDSGGPGAGSDSETIYKFRGAYFKKLSGDELEGPYKSLNEVLTDRFLMVTDATVSIWCSELSAEELTPRLYLTDIGDGYRVEINDDTYEVNDEELFKLQEGE